MWDEAILRAFQQMFGHNSTYAGGMTILDPEQEGLFMDWYAQKAGQYGLDPNPDDPRHYYDYRAAYLAGAGPSSPIDDIQQREPYDTELEYFRSNPNVAGMATEDNSVIINPFSSLSGSEVESVLQNERARVYMRSGKTRPKFGLTEEQRVKFKGYGSLQDIRETVAARVLSGDPSAGVATREQRKWVQDNLSPHWPSQFKLPQHPNRFVDGIDTITGQPRSNADVRGSGFRFPEMKPRIPKIQRVSPEEIGTPKIRRVKPRRR